MIEKKTLIDRIEIGRGGEMSIRFALVLTENSAELATRWHRVNINLGEDLDTRIDQVDAALISQGNAAMDRGRVPQLRAIAAILRGQQGSQPR